MKMKEWREDWVDRNDTDDEEHSSVVEFKGPKDYRR
jgi:hypothetical protein